MVIDEESNETEILNEGIKLEMSGNQFVRWINGVTNKESRLKFYADGDPPVISDSLFGAPRYTSNQMLFYGKGLKCKIKAKDKLSGVDKTYYSIDGTSFREYIAPLDINNEKTYNMRYYSVDNTGYANVPRNIDLIVDLTSPSSEYRTLENFIDNVLSSKTKIKLSAEDKISGVENIYYKFGDSTDFSIYKSNLPVSHLKNGEHVISYYSTDHVGNLEDKKEFVFYLDKEAPKPEVIVKGQYHEEGSKFYISAHSLIHLSATDDKIGVEQIYYAINNASDYLTYENPFPLSLKSGQFYISFYAKDKLGNTSTSEKKYYQMDLTPPETKNKVDGPSYAQRSTVWITQETKISLTAKDSESGLKKTDYIIGEDQPKKYEGSPIQITSEGNFLFRYFSYDNVGNREGDNVLLLIADNSPPDIKEIFSVSPVDTITKNEETIFAYPQYTTLFLAATDMSSGLKGVWYTLNNNAEQEYYNSILCDKTGEYNITVLAKDNLDHISKKNIRFIIKKLDVSY